MGSIFWPLKGRTDIWNAKYHPNKGGALGADKLDLAIKYGIPLDQARFIYPPGNIGLLVIVFCACASVALTALYVRRKYFQGELGGEGLRQRWVTFAGFIGLWVVFLSISIAQAKTGFTSIDGTR